MHTTYNGRRIYTREDLYKAAALLDETADRNIKMAGKMLHDMADGLCDDDAIVCGDDFTEIDHSI